MALSGGRAGDLLPESRNMRSILEAANYHEIAKGYDPLDPVGLTISALIPCHSPGMASPEPAPEVKTSTSPRKPAPGCYETVATPER